MSFCRRFISLWLIAAFVSTSLIVPNRAYAQEALLLPKPGAMVDLSPAFDSVMVKGLRIHPDNPLLFDFVIDPGDDTSVMANSEAAKQSLKEQSMKLIKYFLACLTIPEDELWVNLSPYEKDRMISKNLGETELGRDMLAQDYILKQLTASLIYPEKELGREFWDRVYKKAQALYGTTQIPMNTFNKVWVLADTAKIYEHKDTAYVVSAHLKIMLDEDYLAANKNAATRSKVTKQSNTIGSQVIRDIILPEIEKEVNTGKSFAPLRQIFHSFVLASWYKKTLKQALLNQVYANKAKTNGLAIIASEAKQSQPLTPDQIYQQYLQAYKKGVFNYIKDPDPTNVGSGATSFPRKYFSGGERLASEAIIAVADKASLSPPEAAVLKGLPDRAVIAVTDMRPPSSPAQRSILVVDDDPDLRDLLFRFLGRDYQIFTAEDGQAGLDKVKEHGPFDLVITDFNMPGMDGKEMTQQLKQLHPDMPVIFTSGNLRQSGVVAGSAEFPNVKAVLQKAYGISDLSKVVNQLLPSSQAMLTKPLILYVDQQARMKAVMLRVLEDSGWYSAEGVVTSEEALARLRDPSKAKVQLIVSADSGGLGARLARDVQDDSTLRGIPFILTSGGEVGVEIDPKVLARRRFAGVKAVVSSSLFLEAEPWLLPKLLAKQVEGKEVIITPKVGAYPARQLADTIKGKRPDQWTLAVVPTGNTAISFWEEFRKLVIAETIDLRRVSFVNMYEYFVGPFDVTGSKKPWAEDEQSFRYFMNKHLYDPLHEAVEEAEKGTLRDYSSELPRSFVNLKEGENIIFFQGDAENPQIAIDAFNKQFTEAKQKAGGIDMVIGGIGTVDEKGDGGSHIAFNEGVVTVEDAMFEMKDGKKVRYTGAVNLNDFIVKGEDVVIKIQLIRDAIQRTFPLERDLGNALPKTFFVEGDPKAVSAAVQEGQRTWFYFPSDIRNVSEIENFPTRRVNLTVDTIRRNSSPGKEIPLHALTIGMGEIKQAKNIIIMAGDGKAASINKAFEPPSTRFSASLLPTDGRTTYVLTPNAAEGIADKLEPAKNAAGLPGRAKTLAEIATLDAPQLNAELKAWRVEAYSPVSKGPNAYFGSHNGMEMHDMGGTDLVEFFRVGEGKDAKKCTDINDLIVEKITNAKAKVIAKVEAQAILPEYARNVDLLLRFQALLNRAQQLARQDIALAGERVRYEEARKQMAAGVPSQEIGTLYPSFLYGNEGKGNGFHFGADISGTNGRVALFFLRKGVKIWEMEIDKFSWDEPGKGYKDLGGPSPYARIAESLLKGAKMAQDIGIPLRRVNFGVSWADALAKTGPNEGKIVSLSKGWEKRNKELLGNDPVAEIETVLNQRKEEEGLNALKFKGRAIMNDTEATAYTVIGANGGGVTGTGQNDAAKDAKQGGMIVNLQNGSNNPPAILLGQDEQDTLAFFERINEGNNKYERLMTAKGLSELIRRYLARRADQIRNADIKAKIGEDLFLIKKTDRVSRLGMIASLYKEGKLFEAKDIIADYFSTDGVTVRAEQIEDSDLELFVEAINAKTGVATELVAVKVFGAWEIADPEGQKLVKEGILWPRDGGVFWNFPGFKEGVEFHMQNMMRRLNKIDVAVKDVGENGTLDDKKVEPGVFKFIYVANATASGVAAASGEEEYGVLDKLIKEYAWYEGIQRADQHVLNSDWRDLRTQLGMLDGLLAEFDGVSGDFVAKVAEFARYNINEVGQANFSRYRIQLLLEELENSFGQLKDDSVAKERIAKFIALILRTQQIADAALISNVPKRVTEATAPGGIDLKRADLKMDVEKQDGGMNMVVDRAMVARFEAGDFSGVKPEILRIVPAATFSLDI